jgi:hypothetical protein
MLRKLVLGEDRAESGDRLYKARVKTMVAIEEGTRDEKVATAKVEETTRGLRKKLKIIELMNENGGVDKVTKELAEIDKLL